MTSALEDQVLRAVLAHEADRHDVPAFDPDAVVAAARAGRRRGRALVGVAALAVTAVISALALTVGGLARDDTSRDIVPQGGPRQVRVQVDPTAPTVPWCGWRASDHGGDVLHVGGEAFATPCTYWNPGHRYLWYHAGRLVMSSPDGLEVFLRDRLVKLSEASPDFPRISLDGRYLAWFEGDALVIQDFVAGARVARAVVPEELSGPTTGATLEGVDAQRRAYALVAGGVVWVLDGGRWIRVRGLPPEWTSSDPFPGISYLTAHGFAVPVPEGSVEGRVTREGEFEPVRTVPLGRAVWSPDRSHVVQLVREGFTAHSALDLGATVRLEMPVDPADVPQVAWDAQWESESTVLLTWAVTEGPNGEVSPTAFVVHRCSALTGDCRVLPAGISVPSSLGNHPGG
jgi:hypothetical protein